MFPLSSTTRLGLISTFCATLLACQTPPPPPPPPPPAVTATAPVYTGPTLPIEQSERGVQVFLPSAALFEVGSAQLNATQAEAYIQRVAHLLQTKTQKNVQLEGHTDNVGSASTNQVLSEARAKSVRDALVKAGVQADRLQTVGFSFNRPIASNATEEGRKLNRRVEMIILDEKVENITQGEAPNAFESAWAKLKAMIDQGLVKAVAGR